MELEELLMVGLALPEGSPTWRAITGLLGKMREQEALAVCDPNLGDAQRHFNAGRLASLIDVEATLDQWRAKACG